MNNSNNGENMGCTVSVVATILFLLLYLFRVGSGIIEWFLCISVIYGIVCLIKSLKQEGMKETADQKAALKQIATIDWKILNKNANSVYYSINNINTFRIVSEGEISKAEILGGMILEQECGYWIYSVFLDVPYEFCKRHGKDIVKRYCGDYVSILGNNLQNDPVEKYLLPYCSVKLYYSNESCYGKLIFRTNIPCAVSKEDVNKRIHFTQS